MFKLRRGLWWTCLILALAGVAVSIYLTRDHYLFLKMGFTGKSFCNLSSYFNCDIVLSSRYSSVGTLPLAGLGLLFYIYLSGALIAARMAADAAQNILILPLLLVAVACAFSIFLALVSFFEIRSFCLLCTTLYLINFLLLIFLKLLAKLKLGDLMKRARQIPWGKSLAYLAVVFAVGGILLHTSTRQYAREPYATEVENYLKGFFAQPVQNFDITGRPFWGAKNAKVVVVEFSDFECPYCQKAAFNLKPLLAEYQDQVKLVFLHFPLDKSCNVGMPREAHKMACQMAFATYCAQEQGKFWDYHDEAFERQPRFSPEGIQKIAKQLKLDLIKFNTCLSSEAAKKYVEADINQGIKVNLEGTPAIFVNGRSLSAWQSRTVFHKVLDTYLNPPK